MKRTLDQLREHFEIERELALKLKNAESGKRAQLYSQVYEELYRRVPLHPQLTLKDSPESVEAKVSSQLRLIRPFLDKSNIYMELGAGDCALSERISEFVDQSLGLDVSETVSSQVENCPGNFRRIVADAVHIPVADSSVDFCYSHQLIEHLHIEDARAHLKEVSRVLRPGGRYLCITSNRLIGPHDISRFFSDTAQGLHLREYSVEDLCKEMKASGLVPLRELFWTKFVTFGISPGIAGILEKAVGVLPARIRKILSRIRLVHHILEVRVLAGKGIGQDLLND